METTVVYSGANLTSAYMASWRPEDDSIHVVLIDWALDGADVDYDLKYIRRTANGWTTPVTLRSWTLTGLDIVEQAARLCPQITNQPNGIVIYNVEYDSGDAEGQLNAYWLANADYHDPAVGNWTATTDIATGIDVVGCNAPEYWPAK